MTTLAQKLQIKPGKKWLVYNAIEDFSDLIGQLPDGAQIYFQPEGNFDGVLLFVKTKAELIRSLAVIAPLLTSETIFWISYPKQSSGMASDLKMGEWAEVYQLGLQGVASMAVNNQWAGSRFRPIGQSKISGIGNAEIKNNEYANYIDVERKIITLPHDLKTALEQSPQAYNFYRQLSYSNRKEYVLWVLTAKQEKTRQDRLIKTIEKLLCGKKNPAEK